jgi:hypothetical protein
VKTAILLLAIVLCLAPGCATRQGPVGQGPDGPGGRVTASLPTTAEGLPADATGTPGWDALRRGDFQRATARFDGETGAAARSGAAFAMMGLARFSEASEALDQALLEAPGFGPALLGRALLLRLEGRPEESVDLANWLPGFRRAPCWRWSGGRHG